MAASYAIGKRRWILDLVANGSHNGEIAPIVGLHASGVAYHIKELLSLTGTRNRAELAPWWEANRDRPRS